MTHCSHIRVDEVCSVLCHTPLRAMVPSIDFNKARKQGIVRTRCLSLHSVVLNPIVELLKEGTLAVVQGVQCTHCAVYNTIVRSFKENTLT